MTTKRTPSSNTQELFTDSNDGYAPPRKINISVKLQGEPIGVGEWPFLVLYNGQIYIDIKWKDGAVAESPLPPIELRDPYWQALVADKPLILLLRNTVAGKGAKDPDPLLNPDNRAGASVDLFPLVLGENEIFITVPLVYINSGELTDVSVEVNATTTDPLDETNPQISLMITMISAHCLPYAKDGTVYIGAIGLDDVLAPCAVNFGMSLSSESAKKVVWASSSNGGQIANTAINAYGEDKFIPDDLLLQNNDECRSYYWNAMKRVLVDPVMLRNRLSKPFLFEIAGVPQFGKIDLRGRYTTFIDAKALTEPGQFSVTTCAKLKYYNELDIPENIGALLELPPTSAKQSAREMDLPTDEFGHNSYIVIRFDLNDALVPRIKIATLYETIGLIPPEGPSFPVDELIPEPAPDDPTIDVRKIRKEGGALAVHKELSGLACRGAIPMNQGIKRTAANRLLTRVRAMLKQFTPGACSYVDWQDIITRQHAASRRAVTSSFSPQPPPPRFPPINAAARCRMGGDHRIANIHINHNLKYAPEHPRTSLWKALQCLEQRNDIDAKNYTLEGLAAQPRNKYLLWMFGGQEFDKGSEVLEMAAAAFYIVVKGDYSDGTSNAIGWAAIHAIQHYNENYYAAFVAAKRMRKSYELNRDWNKFIQRWYEISGQEEAYWIPSFINHDNPLTIAAAFFLCLRCYKFSDYILKCVDRGCATNGSRFNIKTKDTVDIHYLRAVSLLLKRNYDQALQLITSGTKKFGPLPMMLQIRVSCLACIYGWNGECEIALTEAEKAGSELCPTVLMRSAMEGMETNPRVSLQRAARAQKIAPCAHSAIIIAKIYNVLGEEELAEKWASAAVKAEPLLADGWGVLALLAMRERNVDKARTMLRTAKQVGVMSPDLEEDINSLIDTLNIRALPDFLVQNLCFCDYYNTS